MPSTETPASARPHPTILVVDDDDYVHGTLAAALRQLKPNLIQARTAADGLARAIEHRPALAIVDLGLPDASGYELTERLRATPGLEALRIVILTGYEPDPAADYVLGWTEVDTTPERVPADGDDAIRALVSDWLAERRSLLAAVRSQVLPEADVVLLNPLHPDAVHVAPLVTRPFSFADCLHTPPMLARFSDT